MARIVSATVIHDREYTIPDDFAGLSLLKSTWSIYHGEETVFVKLRFSPSVARRVRETNWHPSQTLMNDGQHVIMTIQVDNTTDLIPWIRGWGASVEVLEPKILRNKLVAETRKLMQLYDMQTGTNSLDDTFNTFFGD
ncbi:MAG: WYL domain-containing protein [Chloroflexota bacterium]